MSTYSQIIISSLKENHLLMDGKLNIDLDKPISKYYLDYFNRLCKYNGFGQGLVANGMKEFLKSILQDFGLKLKVNAFYDNSDDNKLLDYISFLISWQMNIQFNPHYSAVYKLLVNHRKNVTGTYLDIIATISIVIITIVFVIKICG